MLRIVQCNSVSGAQSYYTNGLAREDYYAHGGQQEIVGQWGGRGAERLGLTGQVTAEAFAALCDNKRPGTGERLTQRDRDHRKVGYDINWHAPKSVSVLYALSKDERVVAAFREAVQATMREMEADVRVRVRKGGVNADRITGEAIWGEFVHFTARPVNGLPDPHLHAHCFTFNASYDSTEDAWKAAQMNVLKEDAPYFEAAMHARLAQGLRAIGYGVTRTAKGWEVAGVPESVISKFSRRTAVIEAEAKKRGIEDAHGKDDLGRRTRENKDSALGMEDLRREWLGRLSTEERAALVSGIRSMAGTGPSLTAEEALGQAALHSFERQSVISERRLLGTALRYGVGSIAAEGLRVRLESPDWIAGEVEGKRMVTTRAVLAEEERMVAFAREGKGTCRQFSLPSEMKAGGPMNAGQLAVAHQVLGSCDRVVLLRGAAGTGKTTLMRSVVNTIEAGGQKVMPVAPTAEASRGVLRADGFKRAETVAKLLADESLQKELKGNVLWVDEAGQVGTQDMAKLFALAEKAGARVILTGDSRQHASVPRGDALRILESQAGLPVAEVRQIVRQKGTFREAVGALSRGDVAEGFDRLDKLGWVREIPADGAREQAIATEYLQALHEGRTVLAIAPTHAEGRAITTAIRKGLESHGKLGAEERSFLQLVTDSPTEAERKDAVFYQPGMVVEFHQAAKGFKAGTRAEVAGVDDKGQVLVRHGKATAPLPLEQASRFQVFRATELTLRKGDSLRITKNAKDATGRHRINRGAVYQVAGFTASGDVKLANGWTLPKDFGNWSHGYVLTSHASQGKTVDRVLIAESTQSLPAASREQFYVSASRARESVTVFTDSKRELKEAIQSSGHRVSARELQQAAESQPGALQRHAELIRQKFELARAYASQKVADITGRSAKIPTRDKEQGRLY